MGKGLLVTDQQQNPRESLIVSDGACITEGWLQQTSKYTWMRVNKKCFPQSIDNLKAGLMDLYLAIKTALIHVEKQKTGVWQNGKKYCELRNQNDLSFLICNTGMHIEYKAFHTQMCVIFYFWL